MFSKDNKKDLNDIKWATRHTDINADGCFKALVLICDKLDEINASLKAVLERLPEKPEQQSPPQ